MIHRPDQGHYEPAVPRFPCDGAAAMPDSLPRYTKRIGSDAKDWIIVLLNHSYSMVDPFAGTPKPKSEALASAINRLTTS
jgi:hypothetical protein